MEEGQIEHKTKEIERTKIQNYYWTCLPISRGWLKLYC